MTRLQAVFSLSLCITELVYCGRKLNDDLTLASYGIRSGSTVHILRKSWPEHVIRPGESCLRSAEEHKEWRWRWTLASSKKTKEHHEYSPSFIPVCSPIEPVDKVAAAREFRVLQAALHTSTAYRDSVCWLDRHTDSTLTMSVSAAASGSSGTCLSSCSLFPGVQDAAQQGVPRPDHRGNTWAEQRSCGSRYDCRQKWFVMWGVLKT